MRAALPCVLAIAMVAGCHSSGRERPARQAGAPQSGCVRPPEQSIPCWNPPPTSPYPSCELFEEWTREIRDNLPTQADSQQDDCIKRAWIKDALRLLRELRKGAERNICDSLEDRITRFLDEVPHPQKDSITFVEKAAWLTRRLDLLEKELRDGEGSTKDASMGEYVLGLSGVVRAFYEEEPRTEDGEKALHQFEARIKALSAGESLASLSTSDQGEWLERRLSRLRESFAEAETFSVTSHWLDRATEPLRETLLRARLEQLKQVDREIDEIERKVAAE